MAKFKGVYLSEAEDHIQRLNDNLLLLEKKPDEKPLLDELMRSSHTLKGSSAAMGYAKTAFLTHVMEDVFDYARNGQLKITPEIVGMLFETVDTLETTIDSIKKEDKETDVEAQANILKKITGVVTEGIGKSLRDASGKPIVQKTGKKPPDAKIEQRSAADSAIAAEKIEHIKVPVERLDKLMDLLEELVIDKMKLTEEAKRSRHLTPLADHHARLVADLQYQLMQARLVPVEQIFARFPRLVRDISLQMGKKIDFQIIGGNIGLDRTIIDKLAEPLVHLLKNAADHGIEKSGTIKLTAAREKEFTIITVEDDGKGIDLEKVKQEAIKRGIVSSDEAKKLDKNGLIRLLLHSKLSTNETVTETSGRGVGLGIVREFAEQNRGRLTVETGEKGTKFRLELPLSLAIINSLIVEVSGRLFVIPFSTIERSVRIGMSDIKSMADQDVAVIGGNNVPLVYLSKLFSGIGNADLPLKNIKQKSILVVLVRRGEESVGIVVDALRDELEVIVKPLPPVLQKTKGFSGSTILGDGRAILIVDTLSLLEDASKLVRTNI
ncbi:MAG: chemotaxis protein CheA [Candidatus Pacebacteria bacterium]|nr:chemotaxis protein CheA [Candidatus Paceibacterota bacterium]